MSASRENRLIDVATPHSDRTLLFVLHKAFMHAFVSETDSDQLNTAVLAYAWVNTANQSPASTVMIRYQNWPGDSYFIILAITEDNTDHRQSLMITDI